MSDNSSPLTALEAAICDRIRQIREMGRLSQVEMSNILGISRAVLANIESGRTALRFSLGDLICERFNVCQEWLARGKGQVRGYAKIPIEIRAAHSVDALFSDVYWSQVSTITRRARQDQQVLSQEALKIVKDYAPGVDSFEEHVVIARHFFERIPAVLRRQYLNELLALSSEFVQATVRSAYAEAAAEPEKKILPEQSENHKHADVKSELPNLLKKVAMLTKPKGAKAMLASALGVPQSRISEWLGGKYSPSGDIALKLLRWVEQQEAK